MSYKEIKAEDLAWNPFTQIGNKRRKKRRQFL